MTNNTIQRYTFVLNQIKEDDGVLTQLIQRECDEGDFIKHSEHIKAISAKEATIKEQAQLIESTKTAEFKRGVKEAFDRLLYAACNTDDHNRALILTDMAYDILEEIDPEKHTEWKQICELENQKREQAAEIERLKAGLKKSMKQNWLNHEEPDGLWDELKELTK